MINIIICKLLSELWENKLKGGIKAMETTSL